MKDIYDLKEKLEAEGWVVSLHVSASNADSGDVDVMAAKNGSLVFFNVIQLKGHSSTVKTISERKKMNSVVNKASDNIIPAGKLPTGGANAYFAIWKRGRNVWLAEHYNTGRIRYQDSHDRLKEVLNSV